MMYEKRFTARQIAAAEGVPANSVAGIAKRYTQQISAMSNPRSGQPKKIGEAEKRRIRRMIMQNPLISNREIISTIPLNVCEKTLASFLKSEGIRPSHVGNRTACEPTVPPCAVAPLV
jgi:transposase